MVKPPSPKQAVILRALTNMLENPDAGRITTAALAKHLDQSEAALYRHYPGKAAMFESLIAQTRAQIIEDLAHIAATERHAQARLRKQVHALLLFVERHRATARVLTGGALAGEAPALLEQVNALLSEVQSMLADSAQLALPQPQNKNDRAKAHAQAGVLMDWVRGCWLHYALSGWQARPTADLSGRLVLLGL